MPLDAMVRRTLGRALAANRFLDFGLGIALMRDRRVPMPTKALAVGLGGVLTTLLVVFEVPVEGLVALALPLLGAALDVTADGAEEVLGTLILATLLLPHLAPRELVQAVKNKP